MSNGHRGNKVTVIRLLRDAIVGAGLFAAALAAGLGPALATPASPGCSSFSGSYNQGGTSTISGSDFTSSGGFYAGDKLVVTVHSVDSGDGYYVQDTNGSSTVIAQTSASSSYTIPSTTTDSFYLKNVVFHPTGNYFSWSCTPTSSPPSSTSQNIGFNSSPPSPASVGSTYSVSASASSGLGVSLSIDSSASSVCSISGSTVHFNATGTCTVDANQSGGISGSTYYGAASQAQQSFTITAAKSNQSISFSSSAPSGATINGSTYTPSANATSGLSVALTIDGSSSSVCSISSGVVSFQGAGSCVIDANQSGNGSYNAAPQAQQIFTVSKASQSINFTSSAPSSATVSGATYTPSAGATSGLTVAFTINGGSSSVCSISSGVVSFQGPGSCVVNANQSGNSTYNAASQVQQSFTVSKASQSISFTSSAPSPATVGGATYTPSASASPSGLTVALTIDSGSSSVCSISSGVVSFQGPGSCVINADQSGNSTYKAASQVQQSFTVSKLTQSITFSSTAPSHATVGGATYTPSASASPSGLTVVLTIDGSSSSVCSISSGVVSFQVAGSCIIDANQSGNGTYNATPQVQQTVTVSKNPQTINFTSTAPTDAVVSGATYTPTASASPSGLTVALTIDAGSASVCSISGGVVSFQAAGSCVIDADQSGNANYNAASQVQQTFTVGKGTQTVNFTSTAPTDAVVSGATYTPTASASPSGLTVALTIDAGSASVCSISGGVVSFQAAGSCVIDADQSGSANYNAASQVQQTVTVGKGTQTVNFTSTAPTNAVVSGATYTPTATASPSGLTVVLTIDASSASVCSISGGVVSFQAAGSCVIDADQSGSANYNAASQVQQTVTVGKGTQTVNFTSTAPTNAVVSGTTYTPTASASPSGLTVALTIDAGSASVCSISGGVVSFQTAGSCVIDADQSGNANYNAATEIQQTLTVGKGAQTVNFTSTAPTNAVVSGATYTPTATASPSGLTVALTIDASSASVCAISGGVVSFQAAGSCVIDANQSGSANYNAASQVQQTVTVGKGAQTVNFTSTAPTNAVVSGATYTPTATASPSGLTVALTIDAGSASVCAISGGVVSFQAAGSCVIDANQSGSANYNAASQVQQTFTVGKGTQTIGFTSTAPAAVVGGPTYTPTATASPSGLTIAFTIDAGSSSICSIAAGVVSFQNPGSCVIDANQGGNANYLPAPQKQQSFTVNKASPTIVVQASSVSIVFGAPETFTATVSGGVTPAGTVTFKDGNTVLAIVALSGTMATYKTASLAVGGHSIVAIYNGDARNSPATSTSVAVTINVRPNPALNPDVAGLVSAQVATAVMFGQAQLTNTEHRLEELHDDDDDPDARDQPQGPGLSPAQQAQSSHAQNDPTESGAPPPAQAAQSAYGSHNPYGTLASDGERPGSSAGSDALDQALAYSDPQPSFGQRRDSINQIGRAFGALSSLVPAGVEAINTRGDLPFHVWFAGAMSFGTLNTDGSYNKHFNAAGLTIGFDRKLFDGFTAGVAFGVGLNQTSVGTNGTSLDAKDYSGTIYASYRLLPHTFLDAIAGYGKINSDDNRWSSDANMLLSGTRGGKDVYGSLSLTKVLRDGAWKFSPYVKVDVVHVDLDAYGETGSPIWDLTYNDLSTTAVFAVAGTRLGYTIPQSWGTLTPTLRLEYSHALSGSYDETLSYTSLPGTNYLLAGNAGATTLYTGGLGLRAVSFDQFSANVEYSLSGTPHGLASQQIRANLKQAF